MAAGDTSYAENRRKGIRFLDSAKVGFGTGTGINADVDMRWDGTDLDVLALADDSVWKWGNGTNSFDMWWYGDTADDNVIFDASAKTWKFDGIDLTLEDSDILALGDANDITFTWNGSKLVVGQATANSAIDWGADGAGIDHVFYGDTASANLTWDQSGDALFFNGAASARGLRTSSATAAAITGATTLTLADSGGVFSVSQAAAYDIDLPSPTTGPGCRYVFYLTGAAANAVTITVDGGAATFVGTIVNDVTSVIAATGDTLTFASGAAALGDTIEIISISTSLYLVRAVSSAAGGITVA